MPFFIQHNENVLKFLETTTETQHFPVTAHFFLFLFTVLVSIILMNLLVGLAVSDIQGLSKSARLHQLIQQVPGVQYILSRRNFIHRFRDLMDILFQSMATLYNPGLLIFCSQSLCERVLTVFFTNPENCIIILSSFYFSCMFKWEYTKSF